VKTTLNENFGMARILPQNQSNMCSSFFIFLLQQSTLATDSKILQLLIAKTTLYTPEWPVHPGARLTFVAS
jgi:hypothetical protein